MIPRTLYAVTSKEVMTKSPLSETIKS